MVRFFLNILPVEQNPAGIRHQQTVEMTDQGGFPASVFSGKHNEIIPGYGQTNLKYACIPRTKGMGQMICFQQYVIHKTLTTGSGDEAFGRLLLLQSF